MKYLFSFVTTLLVLCSCAGQSSHRGTTHSVMTVEPQAFGLQETNRFSGVIKESSEISLGFKTPGQIQQILVKEGDYVRQGQLLATLDAKDYQLGVESAEAQYDQMKKQVERMKKLYDARSLSKNDYEKAVSGLVQLEVQLKSNRNKLEYTRLYSPTNGYVQSVNFEKAEMVNAGTGLFTLLDVNRMEIEVNVPKTIYLNKNNIQTVEGKASIGEDIVFPLKMVSVTPKADGNQLYKMNLMIDGTTDKRLTAGMNVEINIHLTHSADNVSGAAYTLPLPAIFEYQGKSYVWVVASDSTVSRKEVSYTVSNELGVAVVTSGLQGNEQVVKAGVNVLQDKEKVTIIGQPSETNVGGLI